MTEEISYRLREVALKMSRDLHPDYFVHNQQYAMNGTIKASPTVDTVLLDADKIYEWLSKSELVK